MPNLSELAARAMTLARNHIVMHLRFMDMAVFRLRAAPADTSYATEGMHLFYGEKHVLRRYLRFDQQGLSRDYLHILLHCVFRHPFIASLVEQSRWDIACDIAVNDMILSMNDDHFAVPGDDARRRVIEQRSAKVKPLTAERLYRYFADNPPELSWYDLFRVDDHVLWHKPKQARDMKPGQGDDGGESGGNSKKGAPNDAEKQKQPEGKAPEPQKHEGKPGEKPPRSDSGEGSPQAPDDGGSAGISSTGEASEGEGPARQAAEARESDGQTGRSMGRWDEPNTSEQRNVGPGMDTEGAEGVPAGSQSRNDRTDGGLDAPHSMGISGDAGDAASQSDSSDSGGSGSGLNDALLDKDGFQEAPSPALREDSREDRDRKQLEQEWRDVGERIQTDLDTFSRQRGENAGDMLERLKELNRERIDYAEFLRKFTVLGEAAEINNDDFDQIFYTYGLRLYGNLPLIEPLETKEVMRVRDFVVAIDTSGSTSGALVRGFLEKTWGILKGEENFFRRMNLYVIQCDAEIREAVKITSQREFDDYMDTFAVKGLGGTDFRPVFQYVDDLLSEGAFTRLRGLIYFTDGIGAYPARKPDYETAFVFLRGEAEPPAVPPWAMRVILEDGDFQQYP